MGIDNMKPGRDALKESRISVRNFRITRVFLEEIFELQTNTLLFIIRKGKGAERKKIK
jgi:hypothetical protein